ncbi:hypothetical protein Tsubulata_020490 [Turnera subulata]|uniref:Prolamin-like domain-containing protein n=1 Tax=Turnera subulata TaxID=218843 RepID=A0A9Q0F462_9ROSI|nr:hypothetical protein Tsubulata_020490 [Turnera subulata]
MGRVKHLSCTMVFLLCLAIALVVSPVVAADAKTERDHILEVDAAATTPSQTEVPPTSSPDFPKFLSYCLGKISPKCGEQMSTAIFENAHMGISKKCCGELVVVVGRICYENLVVFMAGGPEDGAHAYQYLARSQLQWNNCISMVAHAPSAYTLQ